MANQTVDLASPSLLKAITDHLGSFVRLMEPYLGDGTEPYKAVLSGAIGASDTTLALVAPTSGTWKDVLPPMGTVTLSIPVSVALSGTVTAGDILYLNGVAFTCVASGAVNPQFNAGVDDNATGNNLANAINACTDTRIDGIFTAEFDPTRVMISLTNPTDLQYYPLHSNTSRLASTDAFVGGGERIRYTSVTGNNLAVGLRGADGTFAGPHVDASRVFLPASAARFALRLLEDLVGDATELYGVGANSAKVIDDFNKTFDDQIDQISWKGTDTITGAFETLTRTYLDRIEGHITSRAQGLQTDTPSWITDGSRFQVSDLNDELRYNNDRDTGTPYSCMVSDYFALLYWLANGGTPLDPKVVYPQVTPLASCVISGGGVYAWTYEDGLTRWSQIDASKENRIQGYAGQRLRARVTVAGNGNATLSFACQGMASDGDYFGRPKTVAINVGTSVGTTNAPNDGDTVTVAGVVFTFRTAPSLTHEIAIGATNVDSAANLAAAIQALTNAGTLNLTATANSNTIVLTIAETQSTDPVTDAITNITDNYLVVSSNSTRLPLSAGTLTAQTRVTLGGGAGASIDGTGADSEQPDGVSGDDDTRTFSNGQTLDLTAVGNTIFLYTTDEADRALQIVLASGTGGDSAEISIETVPDRQII